MHCEQFAPTQGMLDEYKKETRTLVGLHAQIFGFNASRQIESTEKQLLELCGLALQLGATHTIVIEGCLPSTCGSDGGNVEVVHL